MTKELPDLSKAEWAIMNICWRKGESTARVIYEESLREKKREYQTVKTMLDRIAEKGYLHRRKLGPLSLFEPAISKAKARARAIDAFVAGVLDNTIAPLFSHFVKQEKISQEEIEELEKLIQQSKEK